MKEKISVFKYGLIVISIIIIVFLVIFFIGYMTSNLTFIEYAKNFPKSMQKTESVSEITTNSTTSTTIDNHSGQDSTTTTVVSTTSTTTTTTFDWYVYGGVVHFTDTQEPVSCDSGCPESSYCDSTSNLCII